MANCGNHNVIPEKCNFVGNGLLPDKTGSDAVLKKIVTQSETKSFGMASVSEGMILPFGEEAYVSIRIHLTLYSPT